MAGNYGDLESQSSGQQREQALSRRVYRDFRDYPKSNNPDGRKDEMTPESMSDGPTTGPDAGTHIDNEDNETTRTAVNV